MISHTEDFSEIVPQSVPQNAKTPFLPRLWTSNQGAALLLAKHFNVCDLLETPSSITSEFHYILVDATTPLALVWRAAYLTGGKAQVYQCQSPMDSWMGGGVTQSKELFNQVIRYARSWKEWTAAQAGEALSVTDAQEIAAIVLTYAPRPFKPTLEQLRQRCNATSWQWKEIIEELEQTPGVRQSPRQTAEMLSQEAEQVRLDIQCYNAQSDVIVKALLENEICKRYGFKHQFFNQLVEESLKTNKPCAEVYTSEEFLKLNEGGVSWLFAGLIPRNGITILGGNPGVGKTTLAYDLGVSLMLGEEFLGEKPTKVGKVIFVMSDELPRYGNDKLITRGAATTHSWKVITKWDVSQWHRLEEEIADFQPDLVIIDSFSAIHTSPIFDENSTTAKTTVIQLEKLSDTYNTGILLLHHNSKSRENKGVSRLRGSSSIPAAASVVMSLEASDNKERRRLEITKNRAGDCTTFELELSQETGQFEVISGHDPATRTCSECILDFLKSLPEKVAMSVKEIAGIINWGAATVRKALWRLEQRNTIIGSLDPNTLRHKIYALAEDVPETTLNTLVRPIFESEVLQAFSEAEQLQDTLPVPPVCPTPESQTPQAFSDVGQLPDTVLVDPPSCPVNEIMDTRLEQTEELGVAKQVKTQNQPEQLSVPTADQVNVNTQVWVFCAKTKEWVSGMVEEIEEQFGKVCLWLIRLENKSILRVHSLNTIRV